MKTTVIIPTYNRAGSLARAVRSLLQQRADADLDILIVDDGSTDGTHALIHELKRDHAEIRSISRANGGVAQARNTGLDHLLPDTEIVTFLDSDDVSPAGRFAGDLHVLKNDPEIDITYGSMIATDALDDLTLMPPPTAVQSEITSIHLSCGLFRRSLVDRIGRFDEDLGQAEDTDYLLRIFESGTRFVQTSTNCVYYLRHPGNMTRDIAEAKKYFALAVLKSMRRRKADPSLRLNKPDFAIELPRELC